MKKIIKALSAAVICISVFAPSVFGSGTGEINKEFPEIYDGVYDGYDLDCPHINDLIHDDTLYCWGLTKDDNGKYCLESIYMPRLFYDNIVYEKAIRVPDSVNGKEIEYIDGSCDIRKFDLNPDNKYMKCIDNVIFCKDGSELMSYAKYDERTEYTIPAKTKTICSGAFFNCDNLNRVVIPDSVTDIGSGAFSCLSNMEVYDFSNNVAVIPVNAFSANYKLKTFIIKRGSKLKEIKEEAFEGCKMLSELYLPSLDIKIDRRAFGSLFVSTSKIKLKCYLQPEMYAERNTIKWDKISNASYYEIYQKLSSGEYTLLGKTKSTSHTFNSLKPGAKYTIAVKPIAVIPAANYDKEKDEGYYPETFTIEGTMSEDVVVKG